MARIQVYFDEDAIRGGLVGALRSRGVTVVTALEAGLTGAPDERQLAFATERGCVLYSHNTSDFYRQHSDWVSAGREHAGMILALQQRFSIGDVKRWILRIRFAATAENMRNRGVPQQLGSGRSDALLGSWAA